MTRLRLLCVMAIAPVAGCTTNPNDVLVQLSPEVISSLDGTVAVHATVLADRNPAAKKPVTVSVVYTDRNGTAHVIAPVTGTSDENGVFETTLTGLTWDGTGTVTVAEGTGSPTGAATFAVLDRTPPKATIIPPANSQVSLNNGATIQVHATDEIGVSQVFFESSGFSNQDSTLITNGAGDVTVSFDVQPQNIQVGQTIMLYALAADLSGNQGAATPISVMVVP